MPKKGANINLKGYDDLFSTEESRAEAQQERVQEIPLSELHPFEKYQVPQFQNNQQHFLLEHLLHLK